MRVTGIGGIFFKTSDPERTRAWYREHLGIDADSDGASFHWRERDDPAREGLTVWSPFPHDSGYFAPSERPYMVNFRVDDLDGLLAKLRAAGVVVDDRIETYEYGRFGWFLDPDGTRIELWEPSAH